MKHFRNGLSSILDIIYKKGSDFSATKNPLEKLISAIAFHIHYTIRNYLKNKRNEIRLTYKIPNWVSNEM